MLDNMKFDDSKGTPSNTIKNAEPRGQSEYRYWLTRTWDEDKPLVGFVGVNPSRANEQDDDRTLTHCQSVAFKFGFGGVALVNLFAVRNKHTSIIEDHPDPVGSDNDEYLQRFVDEVDCAIAAWGEAEKDYPERVQQVQRTVDRDLWAIYLTKDGYPKHLSRYSMKKVDPVLYFSTS